MQRTSLRDVAILLRGGLVPVPIAAGLVIAAKLNQWGQAKIVGAFRLAAGGAAAAGFPRVRQSPDGVNFSVIEVLSQDFSQLPLVVYPASVAVTEPYVSVEFTNGAAPTTLLASLWARPQ